MKKITKALFVILAVMMILRTSSSMSFTANAEETNQETAIRLASDLEITYQFTIDINGMGFGGDKIANDIIALLKKSLEKPVTMNATGVTYNITYDVSTNKISIKQLLDNIYVTGDSAEELLQQDSEFYDKIVVEPETQDSTVEPGAEKPTVEPETEKPTVEPETEKPTVEPETEEPAVEPETQPKKSIDELAQEVLDNKWGAGEERKQALTEAGYDYNAVQKRVDEILAERTTTETPETPEKSIDELAQEVLDNKWGAGEERKQALTEAGYDYNAVQKKVNEILASRSSGLLEKLPSGSTLKGIDISYWQGTVNYSKVKASGIEFVILREGYGQTLDAKFKEYVSGFNSVGLPVIGVYHFSYALNTAQAKQEAIFCVNQVKAAGLDKDTIIFYDFEYDTVTRAASSGITLTSNECIAFTKAFCETVESLGYRAGIYSNIDYYRNMYKGNSLLRNYVFWLADYSGAPDYTCAFQQYGCTGIVNGISGNVDVNYLYRQNLIDSLGLSSQSGSTTTTTPEKSIDELAQEVIVGKWSTGDERRQLLTAAGYDYNAVQKRVDEILAGSTTTTTPEKSIDELAQEVFDNKWGAGDERRQALTEAGYDYDAVQKRVNEILAGNTTTETSAKTVDELAQEVIAGKWGIGDERKQALTEAGYDYNAVQKRVNEILANSSTASTATAQAVVNQARAWLGYNEADGSHKQIIDVYNSHTPYARGYKMPYNVAWCATFVSACAVKVGCTDIIPTECSCGYMVALFQNLGEWVENDAYVPKSGDIIFYDWDDNGVGDCTGWPDHVGIVEACDGKTITVIEGNKNNAVQRRYVSVNATGIRGYGVPRYK